MKRYIIFIQLVLFTVIVLAQSFPVGQRQINFFDSSRNRTIPAQVFYPATSAGTNTPFANGQFPLLVFGHGFVMGYDAYQWLWDSIVPRGYIMVLPTTEGGISPSHSNFGLDLKFLNDFILTEGNNPSSVFYQRILGTSAIMGHSMGGGSSVLASANNNNLTTLINFAAAETNPSAIAAAANVTVPTLMFYGLNDGMTPPTEHQMPIYNALSSTCKTIVGIIGGGHCYFANYNFNCSFGESTTSPQPTITREQQMQRVAQILLPYLDFMLKGDANAEQIFYQRLNTLTTITFQRNCLMNVDVAMIGFVTPNSDCGLSSNQQVKVLIKNNGINPISNIPLNLVFNGQLVATETYTNTINSGDTVLYTFSYTLNAGQSGYSYSFKVYSSYSNDEYIYNDTISVNYTNTSVSLPLSVDFTGFNGTNLSSVFPGWKEAQGVVPSGTTSMWVSRNGVGGTFNTTAKVNFYSSPIREWIIGPGFLCGPYTRLLFDVALTAYNSTNPYVSGMGTNDSLRIFYSTDCGTTWKRLTAFGKNSNFTNNLQTKVIDLSAFDGQGIAIAFQAFRETSSANDYDLHLDNIMIKHFNPFDLQAIDIIFPQNQNCYGVENVQVTIKNNGLNTINFSQLPATIEVDVSGQSNLTLSTNLNTGTLAPNSTMNVSVGTIDMSLSGTYTFQMNILFSNDGDTLNNKYTKVVEVHNPNVNISGNADICIGQTTTLVAQGIVSGQVPVIQSNSTTVNIPDNNPNGITSNITISNIDPTLQAASCLKRVIIDSLTHTFVGDLKIELIAPDNSSIVLINRRGGSGDNFIRTVLDPTATVPITSIVSSDAPFTETYLPEENFSNLTGPALGTWKLKVSDLASNDVGKLHKWTIVLHVNNYIVSYSWNNGASSSSIIVSPTQTTAYNVTVTDAKGCSATSTFTVNVINSANSINLGPDQNICHGQSVTLDAGSGFNSYQWNSGETTQSIVVSQSGMYIVEATNVCGTFFDTVFVNVYPLPVVNLGNDTTWCKGIPLTLNAGLFSSYQWSNGQNSAIITIVENVVGTYTYSVTVTDENGCTASDEINVFIDDCQDIYSEELASIKIYPNPVNDKLILENLPLNSTIEIFNLHGQSVFQIQNITTNILVIKESFKVGAYIIKVTNQQGYVLSRWFVKN